jgi:ligand-binding sensor domain-containing protein
MIKRIITILLILYSTECVLIAQEENENLVTFTEKDGIPSSTINSILQDHLGYIWIATDNGLLKYDGYKFHRIDLNTVGEITTYNPFIISLFEDSQFNIWIGTLGGVVKYNRSEDSFHFYDLYNIYSLSEGTFVISAIDEDETGTIWFGIGDFWGSAASARLVYLRKGEKEFREFNTENDSISLQFVYDIEIDNKNNLWTIGDRGLSKLNLETMSSEFIEFENSPISTFNSSLLIDNKGILWGGQWNEGFGSFDPSTGIVKSYSFNSSNSNSISNNNVRSIIQEKDGTFWLGTGNGINHFDPETEKFERFFYHQGSDRNYKDIGIIRTLIKDKGGSLWLGSEENFIHKFNPSNKLFRSYKHDPNDSSSIGPGYVFGLEEDNEGNIWIGGIPDGFNSGLSKYNSITNSLTRIPKGNNNDLGIAAIYQDRHGTIWLGAFSELLTFNPDKNSFIKIIDIFPGVDGNALVYVILEDNLSNFWIGTSDGLFLLDRSNRKIERIEFIENGDGTPGSYSIQHLFESSKNELWIGTVNGLFKYNFYEKTTKSYHQDPDKANSLSSSNIGYIYENKEGILWLGTWLGGLNRFDPESETFTHYTIEDGLPSNNIQGILEDDDNNALWISSFDGISRFDLLTKEFRNFDVSHGVQGSQFARTSAIETSKGEFLFGGRNGLNIFHPGDFVVNLSPPDILISDFKLFNKSVPVGDDSPLQKPIYQTREIILASDENDVSIDFLAIHYVDPSHNEYAYMLENYEDEWRYVGNLNSAIYPNLPPGEYVFRVKAANNMGVWNNEGKSLTIIVLSPWWQTWWAYFFYVLFVLAFLYSIRRFELNRRGEKEKKRILEAENERKTKELEEARELQLSMLPKKLPQLPHLDIAVYMKTATEVGGDYYDFHVALDGTLTVVIGDATGHGMKAGTMVTTTKSLFKVLASNPDITGTFKEMTKCIKEMEMPKLSMCMTLAKINNSSLVLSTAGMPPVYHYRCESNAVDELLTKGMPLGTFDNFPYETQEASLSAGDTVLMLSDGLPELLNEEGEMFGYDRVSEKFMESAHKKPEEIINTLKDTASNWINDNDPEID